MKVLVIAGALVSFIEGLWTQLLAVWFARDNYTDAQPIISG